MNTTTEEQAPSPPPSPQPASEEQAPGTPSSTKPTSEAQPTGLETKKLEFWRACFESMSSPPQIDFDKLATLAGYKNAGTAQVTYYNNRRKLLNQDRRAKEGPGPSNKAEGAKSKKVTPKAGGVAKKSRGRKQKEAGKKTEGQEEGQKVVAAEMRELKET